jgi:23S rRNA (adenine-N6)-dimethyltransferase
MADILRHAPPLPIVELGAGDGAITAELVRLGRPVTAVELDPKMVGHLRRRFGDAVTVVAADMLTLAGDPTPHHVVSNVPFSITTPFLRRLLSQRGWDTAVLLLQWEVARKRAAVGGTTLLTAQWWPWYEFTLDRRVPADAFAPRPSTDGGILVIRRRDRPLLPVTDRAAYAHLVQAVFTARGRGLGEITRGQLTRTEAARWLRSCGLGTGALPRDVDAAGWVSLYELRRGR